VRAIVCLKLVHHILDVEIDGGLGNPQFIGYLLVAPLMPMRAVYRSDAPPGPAGRWLIDHLKGSSRARRKIEA